jgi:hypothetical protein
MVEDIDPDLIRDALKTLNEIIHHVETADTMVDQGIMEIVAGLLKSPNDEVREQAAILCSSFGIGAIARTIFDYAFANLRELLEDSN